MSVFELPECLRKSKPEIQKRVRQIHHVTNVKKRSGKASLPWSLDVWVPSMSSIWSNAIVHSGSSLAIPIGSKVIRVPPSNCVVALEVRIWDYMMKISLEEGHLHGVALALVPIYNREQWSKRGNTSLEVLFRRLERKAYLKSLLKKDMRCVG